MSFIYMLLYLKDDVPSTAPVRVRRPHLDYESSAEVSHHGHAYSNRFLLKLGNLDFLFFIFFMKH